MIRNIITLLTHDLAVGFKNKTLYLILGIPLFVYTTLAFLDPSDGHDIPMKIALIQTRLYEPFFLHSVRQAPDEFAVHWALDQDQALRWLQARQVDAILAPDGDTPYLILTVSRQTSTETPIIVQRLSTLQDALERRGPGWVTAVRTLQAGSIKQETLPTWILMMVLLVSFIVLPAQVAEEKEKQLLLGWMQTPVRESEWLISKLAYGIVLMLLSVLALQRLSGETACTRGVLYLAMLCGGGFCFGALGVCIGLLCRNQASARTLGVLSYLPLLLPAALSDMSREMRSLAPWIPSYHLYQPLRVLLLEGGLPGAFVRSWVSLVVIGLLACLVSHRLMKTRWLM